MTSTNPSEVVARIVDPTGWELFDELVRVRRLLPHEQPSAEYLEQATAVCEASTKVSLAKADAILSAIQPTVAEKAVEAAALSWAGWRIGWRLTAQERTRARAALTAALPFMMEKANG